ncbi:MAG TPA: hypothetical protein VEM15_16355, partial [Thermodesulfobacteriota bacterium]|nr:hypothetical protein [Thermodesulfobacteriota bacterium]
ELEKIKAQEKGELREFAEAAAVGGGRIYPIRREEVAGEREKGANARRFYEIVQSLNETIKNWKGT